MFVFLPMTFAFLTGRVRNSSIKITATSSQKYNCVVPEITIPPPRNVLGNLEVGGGSKIQSFKISQGVG